MARKVQKIQSIYTYLSEFSKEMIDKVIEELDEEDKQLLRKRYGDDLNNPNPKVPLTKEETSDFYSKLIPKIKRRLNGVKSRVIINTIYDILSEYSKEEIDEEIAALPLDQKELIRIRFGSDLENPKSERKLTRNETLTLYNTIIRKLNRKLLKRKNNNVKKDTPVLETQRQPETINSKEDEKSNSLVTKEGLIEAKKIITKPFFTTLLEVLTPKEAIIFSLRIGITGKSYKAGDIAEFLEIDIQDVYDTTNKALDALNENIGVLFEKEQKHNQALKLSSKDFNKKI